MKRRGTGATVCESGKERKKRVRAYLVSPSMGWFQLQHWRMSAVAKDFFSKRIPILAVSVSLLLPIVTR